MDPEEGKVENDASNQQEEVVVPEIIVTPEPNGSSPIEEVSTQEEVVDNKGIEAESFVDIPLKDLIPGEKTDEDEEEYLYVEPNDEILLKLLKDKKGVEADSLDAVLTPKEQKKYAPEMEKFNEFIEKTGNKNYNDFLETQKDWSQESNENVLKSYIKLSNPDLSEKEVNYKFNKLYNTEGLDEEDDEDEITEKGINVKTDLVKANDFLSKRKEEFSSAGGSDEHIPLEYREAKQSLNEYKEQEESFNKDWDFKRNDFVSKTDSAFKELSNEGFRMQLGNEELGFEDFVIKPDNINEIKEYQLDSTNRTNEFFDPKTGELLKPKEYHLSEYMAKNWKEVINKVFERGRAKEQEIQDKLSKNIQPDNIQRAPSAGESVISWSKA